MPLSMSLSDLQVHSLTPAFYNCNRLEIVASIPIGYSAAVADEYANLYASAWISAAVTELNNCLRSHDSHVR